MGVLERIESIIKSNLNELLDKAGNPDKLLKQLVADMESELADARDQMAATIREGKRLRMLCAENEQIAEKWHKKAVLAIQYGKDDLAREALLRKRNASALAADYERECDLHEEVVESLKSALKALEEKIEEARRTRNKLAARKRQAKVDQLLVSDAIESQMSVFGRMEERVMSLSAEAEALAEMNSDENATDHREEELEAELLKLKEKMRNEGS